MSEAIQATHPINQTPLDQRKYSLMMTHAQIQSVTSENASITIMGNTDFTLQGNSVSGQNMVIPNFKEAVTGCLQLANESPTVELESEISLAEAGKLVWGYLKSHSGARTSDIIIDLCLDPELVIEALNKLREDDKVEGKDVQAKQE